MPVLRGDFSAFHELQRRLGEVTAAGGASLKREALDVVGAAFMKELTDEFLRSHDPYGNPWAPLKKQRNRLRDRRARARRAKAGKPLRADKPLVDTGRMRGSAAFRVEENGVRMVIPTSYASFHQDGTGRIPRRQMLPAANTGGLGQRWSAAAEKAIRAVLNKRFPGAR